MESPSRTREPVGILANFLKWCRSRISRQPVIARSAFCDEDGVSQFEWRGNGEVHQRFRWEDVAKVIAFKRDLFTYDEICVALLNESDEVLVLVSEESGSFGAFIRGLPQWLENCKQPDEWWDKVAFPAFEENAMELYRRGNSLMQSSMN